MNAIASTPTNTQLSARNLDALLARRAGAATRFAGVSPVGAVPSYAETSGANAAHPLADIFASFTIEDDADDPRNERNPNRRVRSGEMLRTLREEWESGEHTGAAGDTLYRLSNGEAQRVCAPDPQHPSASARARDEYKRGLRRLRNAQRDGVWVKQLTQAREDDDGAMLAWGVGFDALVWKNVGLRDDLLTRARQLSERVEASAAEAQKIGQLLNSRRADYLTRAEHAAWKERAGALWEEIREMNAERKEIAARAFSQRASESISRAWSAAFASTARVVKRTVEFTVEPEPMLQAALDRVSARPDYAKLSRKALHNLIFEALEDLATADDTPSYDQQLDADLRRDYPQLFTGR